MEALVVALGVIVLLLAVLVAGLLRSHAEILRQLHALGAGEDGVPAGVGAGVRPVTTGFERAPRIDLSGVGPGGEAVALSLVNDRGPTLLAFLSSGCSTCRTFWHALSREFELPTPDTRPVIVTKGPDRESPGEVVRLAPPHLTTLMSTQVWDDFRVPMTPYFLLADNRGHVIGEGSASTWRHLLNLLRQSLADTPGRAATASPVHLDTRDREHFTDDELRRAGIEPGDPSLYRSPLEPES
jgi:hypothetical protein